MPGNSDVHTGEEILVPRSDGKRDGSSSRDSGRSEEGRRATARSLGPNTASYIQTGDKIGELAPGKIADVILRDGDPLEGYWNWLKTKVVIKGGKVVVDKR